MFKAYRNCNDYPNPDFECPNCGDKYNGIWEYNDEQDATTFHKCLCGALLEINSIAPPIVKPKLKYEVTVLEISEADPAFYY